MADRPILQDQIDITDEMIKAGLAAYELWHGVDVEERLITEVFRAMHSANVFQSDLNKIA